MAEKKATIVIKKVKKGGHGGAHGGAWKVAFADFMTAMMCFFLVMWLMGSDEATKASIAAYFNNPSSPEAWRPDLHDRDAIPLGNQTGAGDTVLKGAEGEVPEDLVQRPSPIIERKPDSQGPVDSDGSLSKDEIAAVESLTYALYENQLFVVGSPNLLVGKAEASLKRVQKVAKNFKGSLIIRGSHNDSDSSDYEFQMSRLVELKQHMVAARWYPDDAISVSLGKGGPVKAGERRYEFTFLK
jgi:hypothetical protein